MNTSIDELLQSVFEVSPGDFDDDTRRGELERWDSLGHLQMIAALRTYFGVEIPPEEALDMETVGDVKRIMHLLIASRTESAAARTL